MTIFSEKIRKRSCGFNFSCDGCLAQGLIVVALCVCGGGGEWGDEIQLCLDEAEDFCG